MNSACPDPAVAQLERLQAAVQACLGSEGSDLAVVDRNREELIEAALLWLSGSAELDALSLRAVSNDVLAGLQSLGRSAFLILMERILSDPNTYQRLNSFGEMMKRVTNASPGVRISDVYQDMTVRMLMKIRRGWPTDIQDESKLDDYLKKILENLIRDTPRPGPRPNQPNLPGIDADALFEVMGSQGLTPAADALDREQRGLMEAQLRELEGRLDGVPLRLRAAILLRFGHGWSYPDIAKIWPDGKADGPLGFAVEDDAPESEKQSAARAQEARRRWIERKVQETVRALRNPS